jgi:hypothetical protein
MYNFESNNNINKHTMATYTITINEKTAQGKAIALLLASNPSVEVHKKQTLNGLANTEKSPYNPKFVAKILKRHKDIKTGKSQTITINPKDVWGSLGLK